MKAFPPGASVWTNNHGYEVVVESKAISWEAARDAAERLGGHLATITSKDENAFIFGLVAAKGDGALVEGRGPFIGGKQKPSAPEPAGGWEWITGEPWTYDGWQADEPNEAGDEGVLCYLGGDHWADVPERQDLAPSYVVEYEP